jgi:hypothetical protein
MKTIIMLATLFSVLGVWSLAEAAPPPRDVTIYQVQRAAPNGIAIGDSVRVRDVVITGIDTSLPTYGFWAQELGGGIYSGILCCTGSAFPTGLQRGDIMTVKGVYAEFPGSDTSTAVSEINSYYTWYWEKTGNTIVPDPILLSCRDVGILPTDAPRCERWEGTLVKLDTVVCVRLDPAYPTSNYFLVEAHNHPPSTSADTVYVRNNKLLSPGPPAPDVGDTLISITGLHHYENGRYQICLRDVEPPPPPPFPPNLIQAYSISNTSMNAVFDLRLDKATAENPNNYLLTSETQVTGASLDPVGEQIVTLITGAQVPGTSDTLVACCIKRKTGTPMGDPESCSFRAGICPISYVQTPKSAENDSSQFAGEEVTIAGIVTGDYTDFTTQCYIENTPGGPWSGIRVYGAIPTPVAEGDSIIVAGLVAEYYYETEITSVDYLRIVNGGNPIPGPDVVSPCQINTGSPTAESYENVFVRCEAVYVSDTLGFSQFGEWKFCDTTPCCMMMGHSGNYTYVPQPGQHLNIQGLLDYVWGDFRIEPRRDGDIQPIVGVESGSEPGEPAFALEQNSPNPFNPVTNIFFSISEKAEVRLHVYDVSGRLVKGLVDGWREPGVYSEAWDGRDDAGKQLPSGVYFYRLEAGKFVATKKMVLLK